MQVIAEEKYKFPVSAKLRPGVSLAVCLVILSVCLSYLFNSPPADTDDRVFLVIFTTLPASLVVLLVYQQIHLSSSIRSSPMGIRLVRLGREVLSLTWPEIDEVVPTGTLGDYKICSYSTGKAITVEHTIVGAANLRAAIRKQTGK